MVQDYLPAIGIARLVRTQYLHVWMLSLSAITYVVLALASVTSVRGSDQYWYASNLEALQLGRGLASNAIYPIAWMGKTDFSVDVWPQPIHNIPVVHLAAALSSLLPAHTHLVWVITNVSVSLVGSWLLYRIGLTVASPNLAAVGASLFLLAPASLWWTMNALAEQSVVALGIVYCWALILSIKHSLSGLSIAVLSAIALCLTRPTFLLLALTTLAVIVSRAGTKNRWTLGLTAAAATAGAWAVLRPLFESYTSWPPSRVIAIGTSAEGAEFGWYSWYAGLEPTLSWHVLQEKVLSGLSTMFVPANPYDLFLKTLVLLLLAYALVWRSRDERIWEIQVVGASLLTIYILTSLLFASNVRYLAVAFPTALLLTVVRLGRLDFLPFQLRVPWNLNHLKAALTVAVFVIFLFVDVFLVAHYRTEARKDGAVIAKAQAALNASPGSILAVGLARPDEKAMLELGYAALPKPVLFTEPLIQDWCPPDQVLTAWEVDAVMFAAEDRTVDDAVTQCLEDAGWERNGQPSTVELPSGRFARDGIRPATTG